MKTLPYILGLVACFIFGWWLGHRSYEVRSLMYMAEAKTAVLYDTGFPADKSSRIGTIDISELAPILASSTWKSGHRNIHKGEFHLMLEDGTHIQWRFPGNYFLVDGWPGYFEFEEHSREKLQNFKNRLLEDTVVPMRREKYRHLNETTQSGR